MFEVGQKVYPVLDANTFDTPAVHAVVVEVIAIDALQGQYDYVVDWTLDDDTTERGEVEGFDLTDWTPAEQDNFNEA